jgi:hypothetical protein
MLNKLHTLLQTSSLLEVKAIKDIDKTCCSSSLNVIDFDKTKILYCNELKSGCTPKSADCLYLDYQNHSLFFIEMKDLDSLITHQRPRCVDENEFKEKLESSFKDFNLHDKIIDSYALLLSIIGYYGMSKDFYPYLMDKNKLNIKFILLVNISSRDYIAYRISALASIEKYSYRFLAHINLVRADDLDALIIP